MGLPNSGRPKRLLLALLSIGVWSLGSVSASATTTVTEITRISFSFEATDPCALPTQLVTFEGTSQSVLHFTETDGRMSLIISGTSRLQGFGELGTRYHGADHGLSILSSSLEGADQVINVQNSIFVSSSADPNFVGHLWLRFTITPNGDTEGFLDDFRFECVPQEELA